MSNEDGHIIVVREHKFNKKTKKLKIFLSCGQIYDQKLNFSIETSLNYTTIYKNKMTFSNKFPDKNTRNVKKKKRKNCL